jgi:apolipoprotein D and lipocalin family protein
MRFVWPIKAEYLITHLTQDYSQTVIGRNKRDYVWIMARTPQISEDHYQKLVQELASQGYDVTKLRRTPHKWPEGNGRER